MRLISSDGTRSIEFEEADLLLQDGAILYQSRISKGCLGEYDIDEGEDIFNDIHSAWKRDCMSVYQLP